MVSLSDNELLSHLTLEHSPACPLAARQVSSVNPTFSESFLAAISGGPDSTVLLHGLALFQQICKDTPIIIATVDHGLRPEAYDEACFVKETAQRLGFEHYILQWRGPYPETAVQETARDMRYQLLADLAAELNLSTLITAHTQDDQAETLLMRMSRGSGLVGLSGMRRLGKTRGLQHFRPFLTLAKTQLIATCQMRHWHYFSDPSNDNPKYTRTRWRGLTPLLSQEGLTAERFSRLSERCARANDALDYYAHHLYQQVLLPSPDPNALLLDAPQMMNAPDETGLRILTKALQHVSKVSFLRLERIERYYALFKEAFYSDTPFKQSLGGAILELKKNKTLYMIREPERFRGRREQGHEENNHKSGKG